MRCRASRCAGLLRRSAFRPDHDRMRADAQTLLLKGRQAGSGSVLLSNLHHRLAYSLRHALADTQLARDPVHSHPGAVQLKYPPRHVVRRDWPTEALALSSRTVEPSTRPLDEHRSLELRKYAGHAEECPTCRRRRVNTLLVEVEIDTG